MFDQTFAASDLPKVLVLALIEILLSADNAIVLGLLAHHLPEPLRKRALYIGVGSSFLIRAAGLLFISYLIEYRSIQLLGAAYLVYLSIHHFASKRKRKDSPKAYGFWKAVVLIELFDLAFAIDSIIAGVAFVGSPEEASFHPKLWIVYVGGMIGLIGVRFAAHLFSRTIDLLPRIEGSAYLLVGWIGLRLGYNTLPNALPLDPLFWTVTALLLLYGLTKRKTRG